MVTNQTPLKGELFSEKLKSFAGSHAEEFASGVKIRSTDGLVRWLKQNARGYYEGHLRSYEGDIYPHLLRFLHAHATNRYDLESFSTDYAPVWAWVACANTYETIGRLRMALRDAPHLVSRNDAYIAFRLGILSEDEFNALRPRHNAKKRPRYRSVDTLDLFENASF